MAVPYIFANVPAGTTIPLAEIDANFAYLANSPILQNLSVDGVLTVGQSFVCNGSAAFNNGLSFTGLLGVNGSFVTPTGTTGTGQLVLNSNPTFVSPNLGQPTYGDLSRCSGYPISQVVGLGVGVGQFLVNPTAANLENTVIGNTGVGKLVFNEDATLIAPVFLEPEIGTPASGDLINCIGYQAENLSGITPISHGGTGLSSVGNLNDILQVTPAGTLGYAPIPPAGDVKGGLPSELLYQVNTNITGFIPNGSSGQVLTSNGSLAPSWNILDITTNVTGILPIIHGGTGCTTAQTAINTLVGGVKKYDVVQGDGTNIILAPLTPTLIGTAGTLTNDTTGSSATFTSTTQNSKFTTVTATGNITTTGGVFTDSVGTLHPMVNGTLITPVSTSTIVTFTGIPSWAKRLTVMLNSIQMTGGSNKRFQLGTGAGLVSSGYLGSSTQFAGGPIQLSGGADLFFILATDIIQGNIVFTLLNPATNIWSFTGIFGLSSYVYLGLIGGTVSLGNTLTQVAFTSSSGTETFTGGSINILYE